MYYNNNDRLLFVCLFLVGVPTLSAARDKSADSMRLLTFTSPRRTITTRRCAAVDPGSFTSALDSEVLCEAEPCPSGIFCGQQDDNDLYVVRLFTLKVAIARFFFYQQSNWIGCFLFFCFFISARVINFKVLNYASECYFLAGCLGPLTADHSRNNEASSGGFDFILCDVRFLFPGSGSRSRQ